MSDEEAPPLLSMVLPSLNVLPSMPPLLLMLPCLDVLPSMPPLLLTLPPLLALTPLSGVGRGTALLSVHAGGW